MLSTTCYRQLSLFVNLKNSPIQEFASFSFGSSTPQITIYLLLLLVYIKFADRTHSSTAISVMPFVTTVETHARLALITIIRLVCIPVVVGHSKHRSVRVRRSPYEWGVTTRVNALSSCPPDYSVQTSIASTQ